MLNRKKGPPQSEDVFDTDLAQEIISRLHDATKSPPPRLLPTDQQRAFLAACADPKIRIVIVAGGEQSGKTTFAAEGTKRLWLGNPERTFVIGTPSFKEVMFAADSTWDKFCQRLGDPDAMGGLDRNKGVFLNQWGGKTSLWSAETAGRMIAITAFGVWLDEADGIPDSVLDDVLSRTQRAWDRGEGGKVILSSTFYNADGRFFEWYEIGMAGADPLIRAFQFSQEDLIALGVASQAGLDFLKKTYTPEEYARRVQGLPKFAQGRIFPWEPKFIVRANSENDELTTRKYDSLAALKNAGWEIKESPGWTGWCPPPHWPVRMGLDYGYTDAMCLTFRAVAPDETSVVFDELYYSGVEMNQFFEVARDRPHWNGRNIVVAGGAATEKLLTRSLQAFGCYKAQDREADKVYSRQRVREMMVEDKIRFLEFQVDNCIRSVAKARAVYKKDGGPTGEKEAHKDSHARDALCYDIGDAPPFLWEEKVAGRKEPTGAESVRQDSDGIYYARYPFAPGREPEEAEPELMAV